MSDSSADLGIGIRPQSSALNSPTGAGVNSPGLVATGASNKPKRRAISDVNHIFSVYGDLQHARRSQNEKNGRIQDKLNSERPYDDHQLEAEGIAYKSNFSTKPLSTTAAKVASRLTKAVQAARYLTAAALPDSIPDAKKKTEMFRSKVTNRIRSWPGWYNFLTSVASETAIFGWTVVTWLDNADWHPYHFRQDKVFIPDGTRQSVDSAQVLILQRYLLPHELAGFIEDREAAEAAGWDIDNVVDAINRARPPAISGAQAAPYTDARRYADAIRESTVSMSLQNGAKQVNIIHCLAVEMDGKVSHYIADADAKTILFTKEDRFETVVDCLAFVSYEYSETLMGSKGIGREIYELAGILDRARNEVVDRLQLSGKIVVQASENQLARFKLSVVGNVMLIPDGFTITQTKIESSVEDFIALDQQLTGLLDQIAGGITPKSARQGERVTATEITSQTQREEERSDDVTTRFIVQIGPIVSTIQRRLMSGDSDDEAVKQDRKELLAIMSEDELKQLADQPALRTVEDFTLSEAQKIILIAQESRNDPLYNHRKTEEKKLSVLVNPEFANEILLPDPDPTDLAEQARLQMLENVLLAAGKPVPVSPRDNHLVHVELLKQEFAQVAQAAGGGDIGALQSAEGWLKHWEDHVNLIAQSGNKAAATPLIAELKATAQHLGELQAEAQQKAAQMQQAAAAVMPAGAPAEAAPALAAAPSPALAPAPVAPTA